MQFLPGTLVLNGRYRIEKFLGEGAFAEVYLATQVIMTAPRALKILRRSSPGPDSSRADDYRARFELEARLPAILGGSPHIVQVHEYDFHDGQPVLVMEYVPGETLKSQIQALSGNSMPWSRCAEILRDVATGLDALHSKSFVHRDVKPSNVLLTTDGRAKISDLGAAQTDFTRTRIDGLAFGHPGTPGYASPEHANGGVYLTPAADIYALGVMGFEMLTGRIPYPAKQGGPPVSLEGSAPNWLKALIARMLSSDYRDRPQNGGVVAKAIAAQLRAGDQNPAETARPTHAGKGRRSVLIGVGGLGALALGWVALRPNGASTPQPPPTPPPSAVPVGTKTPAVGSTPIAPANTAQPVSSTPNPAIRRTGENRATLTLSPGVEMELIRVPAGEFLMGSDRQKDNSALDDEIPQRKLALPEYWIGKTEVTISQYAVFAKASKYRSQAENMGKGQVYSINGWKEIAGADWAHPGGSATNVAQKQSHPVSHMSWDDCIAFCAWASKIGAGDVSLPSEAEWEKAARGTDGRIYPWGNERPDATRCNYAQNVKDTAEVGTYGANGASPYGCDDMAGNVWEWTRSVLRTYPYASSDGRESLSSRETRVMRGGSLGFDSQLMRCAYRKGSAPDSYDGASGFRVVLLRPLL